MKQTMLVPAGSGWKEKNIGDFSGPVFSMIGEEWMLISAGAGQDWNTMTASWGGLGVLWGKNVAFMFVRPSRYTFEFTESNDRFSLSFFGDGQRKALAFCGANSGRDSDKAAETGLTPVSFPDGSIGFDEAVQVISCRKLYAHDFDPGAFLDPGILGASYPAGDFHRMYIGEITAYRTRV
ncbi:flavin reductase [Breznakiella homolactica]|uniref:Flavin reductase n=1 Tax=Breznakiella homolactica TaxID=2798577 RepID=A0A7T7XLG4_9SPIR|nr:flavin reductase [Breznakiella homolactica]QQO08589.1 flavin reductase [Breznakiella homolactica]